MDKPAHDRRRKLLTLAATCFGLFMVQLDLTIVNVALPSIAEAFDATVSGLQWVVDGYALVFASLLLAGGGLGDLYGRKRLFLGGLVVFAAGSVLCGLAPSLGVLVVGRVIQGIGAALELPGSLSIITVTFDDPAERARAIGLWASLAGLSLIAGPVLGGVLVDGLGWRTVFWVNVPVAAVAFAVTATVVRESANPEGRRLDLPGQALSTLALAAAIYAVIEGNARGWASGQIVAAFAVAAAAGLAFVAVERRSPGPLLDFSFFRNPTFTAANAVAVLMVSSIYGMLFVFTLFLQNVEGYSAIGAGLRLLPMTAGFFVVSPAGGRLAARWGPRLGMATGMALTGIGVLLVGRADTGTGLLALSLELTLAGVGLGLATPGMVAAAVGAVPPERAGMASGVISTSRQMGGAIGVAILGALLTGRMGQILRPALAGIGGDAMTRDRLVASAASDAGIDGSLLPASVNLDSLQRAVDSAFVSGMHLALLTGGVALLIGAVIAALWVREPGLQPAPRATPGPVDGRTRPPRTGDVSD